MEFQDHDCETCEEQSNCILYQLMHVLHVTMEDLESSYIKSFRKVEKEDIYINNN